MENQEITIAKFQFMLEQNTKEHGEIFNELNDIKDMIKEALEEKANKWVEKVLVWALGCVGVVAIGLLVRWIIFLEIK